MSPAESWRHQGKAGISGAETQRFLAPQTFQDIPAESIFSRQYADYQRGVVAGAVRGCVRSLFPRAAYHHMGRTKKMDDTKCSQCFRPLAIDIETV